LVFFFNIIGILGSLSVTRKYSPEYIEKLVKSREVQYAGGNSPKKLLNKKR
jgi:hypothetical protein